MTEVKPKRKVIVPVKKQQDVDEELNEIRMHAVEIFSEKFENPRMLEKKLYEYTVKESTKSSFCSQEDMYRNIASALWKNFEKVRHLDYDHIVQMQESEMNPDNWKHMKTAQGEVNEMSDENRMGVASSLIKCKCGGNTIITEKQTRSCDEAMTVEATCVKCGKKFRA